MERGLGMRRLSAIVALLAGIVALAGCGGSAESGASKPRLVVSAAASLQTAFTQYGKKFTDGNARFSFAGSDVLASQIRQGLRPDIFASANTTLPDALYAEGLVEKPIRFAANELVLAKRAGPGKISRFSDIERKGVRIAIGSGTVPVGSYTRRMLDQLPLAQSRRILANVRSEEPDVTGLVGKLTQGAVDAAFVYHSDVYATKGKLEEIKLPPTVVPIVEYGIAIVKGARQPLVAKSFIYGLLSGAGRDAIDAQGFGGPLRGPA